MIALIHAAATWFMVGLIWTMQLVHYPALAGAAPEAFAQNTRRTVPVVVPIMLIEAVTALHLLLSTSAPAAWIGVALLTLIWLSTALVQYPLHRRLSCEYKDTAYNRLLRTNRLRVAAWTVRGLLALELVWILS